MLVSSTQSRSSLLKISTFRPLQHEIPTRPGCICYHRAILIALGHDVIPVGQLGLAQADDEDLLRTAQQQGRIFVTRDRDFGNLVFVRNLGAGVIYLRILPSTQTVVHEELARVLEAYTQDELMSVFITVEPGGHRIRRLSGPHNGHDS